MNEAVGKYIQTLNFGPARDYALRLSLHYTTPGTACVPTPAGTWHTLVRTRVQSLLGVQHTCSDKAMAWHQAPEGLDLIQASSHALTLASRNLSWQVAVLGGRAQSVSLRKAVEEYRSLHGIEAEVLVEHYDYALSAQSMDALVCLVGEDLLDEHLHPLVSLPSRRLDVFCDRNWQEGASAKMLAYARRGGAQGINDHAKPAFDSRFEREVYELLVSWGLVVHTQVLVEGYRVDLAVAGPAGYALGIECDGAAYHTSTWARAADSVREAHLKAMGWQLHRIKSTTWFHDQMEAVEGLKDALRVHLPGFVLPAS